MKTVSIGRMVKDLNGMTGTSDLSEWEEGFVVNIAARTLNGDRTSHLSEKQVETIENIWQRHFA